MKLTPFQELKVRHLFRVYDTRQNGVLEREDYELLAHRVAVERGHEPGSARHEQIARYFHTRFERTRAIADFSRDGQIALDEWIDFMEIVVCDPRAFESVVGGLVALMFELFDYDESTTINRAELASFRRAFGVAELEDDLFEQLDRDGSGVLSTAELKVAMEEFFASEDPSAPGNRFFGPLDE